MKHAQDLYGTFVLGEKQDTVVADAEAELVPRRPQLYHVPAPLLK
jgi:hypothetical protein